MLVIHAMTPAEVELDGDYELIYSNLRSPGESVSGVFAVSGNESLVLRKAG